MSHPSSTLLQPGHNCWCLEAASRTRVIIDTADYFAAFAEACRQAERQILILGWDFDRRTRLHPDRETLDEGDEIGAFLVDLIHQKPALEVYLLTWDFNMIYAAERELLPALRLRLKAPRRFHFRLDNHHPVGASHHQKMVVIDDQVAFVGGIDLSRWRWDTREHAPQHPGRIDPDGKPYPPFHDLMLLVEGPAARRLGDLARTRWRRSRGWRIKPVATSLVSPWPANLSPHLRDVDVAIARTQPAYRHSPQVSEVLELHRDAILAAERIIYIENQYFTSNQVAQALIQRLRTPTGPEVVLVLPAKTGGWLEQMSMDVLRARLVERMQAADSHQRLRIYYPHQPGLGDACISVHAKLLIIDDRLVRIGSSNTSNRSMGLDSECDLAIESRQPGDETAQWITHLRHDLLSEHLACAPEKIAQAEQEQQGTIAAIETLRGEGRSLRPLDCRVAPKLDQLVPHSQLVDPPEPFSPDYFVAQYVPRKGFRSIHRRLLTFALIIVALLALAAAWRFSPLSELFRPQQLAGFIESLSSPLTRGLLAILGFTLASLLMVPITLLAIVSGIAFGGPLGFGYILAAALLSAMFGFLGGRHISRGLLDRITGSQLDRLSKRLSRRGTLAVALLRLVPIAPFTVFNLIAGASHLGFRQFSLGTLLGMGPGLGAVTLFSDTLWAALTAPSLANLLLAAGVGVLLAGLTWLIKSWLRSG